MTVTACYLRRDGAIGAWYDPKLSEKSTRRADNNRGKIEIQFITRNDERKKLDVALVASRANFISERNF